MRFIFLVILAFLSIKNSTSKFQAVTWSYNASLKTGDMKLLTVQTTGNAVFTYSQSFFNTFNNIPRTGVSITGLDIQSLASTKQINYFVSINLVDRTFFKVNVKINNLNTFNKLSYFYFGIEIGTIQTYIGVISGMAPSNLTGNKQNKYKISYDLLSITNQISIIKDYSNSIVVPFISSFSMKYDPQYSLNAIAYMDSNSSIQISVYSNNTVSSIDMFVVIIDKIKLEQSYRVFLDYGSGYFADGNQNVKIVSFSVIASNYHNLIFGAVHFQSKFLRLSFQRTDSNTLITNSNFTQVNLTALNFRFRTCKDTSLPYYQKNSQRCYDQCPLDYLGSSYAKNNTYQYCIACDASCYQCQSDGFSCLSCVSINSSGLKEPITSGNTNQTNRYFDTTNKKCPCIVGYFEAGFVSCLACNYKCKTCQGKSNNCLECITAQRNISISSCVCKDGYYELGIMNITCTLCSEYCLTCLNDALNCTSCNATHNRILDLQFARCICASNYQQNGSNILCVKNNSIICSLFCQTCKIISSNCTSCNLTKNRQLVNNECPCSKGYSANDKVSICVEICGDGLMMNNSIHDCDDGNLIDGDGCSHSCTVEQNFTCNIKKQPSECVYNQNYTKSLIDVQKSIDSNIATVYIKIIPPPPANVQPSLLNFKDQLAIDSYILQGEYMKINLKINSEIQTTVPLNISFSIINTSVSLQLSRFENIVLKPYNNSYLELYKAQIGLIWLYIAALWISSILILTLRDSMQLNSIMELFIFSGTVWMGAEGLKIKPLLFEPLSNLVYQFGFNFQIAPFNCLLNIFNFGFLMNILPILIFLVLIPISKRKPDLITTKIKRYILFDLTYFFLVLNLFLVLQGFALSVNNYSKTGLEIGSILIGIIYFAIFIVLSYWLFIKNKQLESANSKFQAFKNNLEETKYLPLYYLTMVICCFIEVSLKKVTNINGIFMICTLTAILFFVGFKNFYINKIRNMINLFILILVYGCYIMIEKVPSADWGGFLILLLMYLHLTLNLIFILLESRRIKPQDIQSSVDEDYNIKKLQNMNSLEKKIEDNNEFDLANHFMPYQLPGVRAQNNLIRNRTNKEQFKSISDSSKKDFRYLDRQFGPIDNKRKEQQFLMTANKKELLINDQNDLSAKEVRMDQL